MRSTSLLLFALLFLFTLPSSAQTPISNLPDIILFNGVIYTGEGFAQDKTQTVEAIAIGRGKVLAVGTNEDIRRLAGPGTVLRDLSSVTTHAFVFPGFNDA